MPVKSKRSPWLAGWSRAIVAMAILAGVSQLAADPGPPPVSAPIGTENRFVASKAHPIQLAGVGAGQVRSLLNVPERMRYGDFVWDEAGVPAGRIWARIDREHQIISIFRSGHEIGTAVILYGAPQKPTPKGRYPVLGKKVFHRSKAYDADMPFTIWLTRDGVAMHAANVREGAATHGCVGLPKEFARKLFDLIRVGDGVIIV